MTSSLHPPKDSSESAEHTIKKTEQRLIVLSERGGPLSRDSRYATNNFYGENHRSRLAFRRELIDFFLNDGADVGKDGLAAIVTAGPPGAGKSTAISGLSEDLSAYRRLDADQIKECLIEKAVEEGIFDKFLGMGLPDGGSILPNELSSLVHKESADLHNILIQESLYAQVNVIIEGTFSWDGLVDRYIGWLATGDYHELKLIDVEVDFETATKQARQRWWDGRIAALSGSGSPLGGRFMAPSAIAEVYPKGVTSHSRCNTNAVNMFNDQRTLDLFEKVELRVYDSPKNNPEIYKAIDGKIVSESPETMTVKNFRDLGEDSGVISVHP